MPHGLVVKKQNLVYLVIAGVKSETYHADSVKVFCYDQPRFMHDRFLSSMSLRSDKGLLKAWPACVTRLPTLSHPKHDMSILGQEDYDYCCREQFRDTVYLRDS